MNNKELFFANYINQNVLCDGKVSNITLTKGWNWKHDDFWLELKSVSNVSDDDALAIMKHYEETANNITSDGKIISGDFMYGDTRDMFQINIENDRFASDYLRSKGYAVAYLDVDVETQIKFGWVKLKGL